MATITNSIKKRFVKDFNLPINVFEDEYFKYFIDLYYELFQTKLKYALLVNTVNHLEGEENFMKRFHQLKDLIIREISSKSEYKTLASHPELISIYTPANTISKKTIYQEEYDGKLIISIDLIKANFSSFKYYEPALINNKNSYDEFMADYTDLQYFKQSKQLRQIIFGNLLPKRQQAIQKNIIHRICDQIIKNTAELSLEIMKAGSDEILISYNGSSSLHLIIKLIDDSIPEEYRPFCKVVPFHLTKIHPEKPFYVKKFEDGKVEFKQIPTVYFPQVFKHYFEIPIVEQDLIFYHEGCKAKFIEHIYPMTN